VSAANKGKSRVGGVKKDEVLDKMGRKMAISSEAPSLRASTIK
jgi:hypothetical protein